MSSLPLSPFENKARVHAHIAFFAFLVGLPIGIISARYLRTFTNGWLWPHAIVNFFMVGPLVVAAFVLGVEATGMSLTPHFSDPHQKAGLALFIMYIVQVLLGAFVHWVKIPRNFPGGHAPQNYIHICLGLAIVALATWQTHYGLFIEWAFATGNVHPVGMPCKHFWLAITIIVWAVLGAGLLLLPRQIKQERAAREAKFSKARDSKEHGEEQRLF